MDIASLPLLPCRAPWGETPKGVLFLHRPAPVHYADSLPGAHPLRTEDSPLVHEISANVWCSVSAVIHRASEKQTAMVPPQTTLMNSMRRRMRLADHPSRRCSPRGYKITHVLIARQNTRQAAVRYGTASNMASASGVEGSTPVLQLIVMQEIKAAVLPDPDDKADAPQSAQRTDGNRHPHGRGFKRKTTSDRSKRRPAAQLRRWSILTAEDHVWFMENQGADAFY